MMLSIKDGGDFARALKTSIDERVKRLLVQRCRQLGAITDQAHFAIVQADDTATDLEGSIGFSVFCNPADGNNFDGPEWTPGWEWIEDHGFAYELCFIMDDSGFAHVVIVPRQEGIDAELIRLCSTYSSEHA